MIPPKSPHTAGRQSPDGILKSLPGRLLVGLCLLQFALIIYLVKPHHHALASADGSQSTPPSPTSINSDKEPYVQDKPGPWGTLEYARIVIEPPDEFVPTEDNTFPKTHWFFAGYTPAQLTNLFLSADLTIGQSAELLDSASWSTDTNGLVVTPDTRIILGMSPATRAQIYTALSRDGRNMFQAWPYTFRKGGFDQWFVKGSVDDSTVAILKTLLYTRGASLCFSDLPEVFAQISSLEERRQLLKTLSRNSTILMKLRVAPDSDIKPLTAYWATGGNSKDVEPLLDSLTEIPGGMTLDVAHLLPPFARKRLNAYPTLDTSNRWPDCYWSSFNFFNDPPDNRYYDSTYWTGELKANYTTVTQPAFGDLIFLLQTNGTPVHAAVYIADDVVFTKNGGNYRQPWILMKWDDLIARYPDNASLHTLAFRSNKRLKQ